MGIFTFNKLSSGVCKTHALFCGREGGREGGKERTNLVRLVFTELMLAPRDHLFSLEMLINRVANQNSYPYRPLASLSTPMMP